MQEVEKECILSDAGYWEFKNRLLYLLTIKKEEKKRIIDQMKYNHMNTSTETHENIFK